MTSGCIGQVHPDAMGPSSAASLSPAPMKRRGFSRKRSRQCGLQKTYSLPSCASRSGASAGTAIPQTGSFSSGVEAGTIFTADPGPEPWSQRSGSATKRDRQWPQQK
jgi:hypothetical protein